MISAASETKTSRRTKKCGVLLWRKLPILLIMTSGWRSLSFFLDEEERMYLKHDRLIYIVAGITNMRNQRVVSHVVNAVRWIFAGRWSKAVPDFVVSRERLEACRGWRLGLSKDPISTRRMFEKQKSDSFRCRTITSQVPIEYKSQFLAIFLMKTTAACLWKDLILTSAFCIRY